MKMWAIWCDKDIDNLEEIEVFNTKEEAEEYFIHHKLDNDDYFIYKHEC